MVVLFADLRLALAAGFAMVACGLFWVGRSVVRLRSRVDQEVDRADERAERQEQHQKRERKARERGERGRARDREADAERAELERLRLLLWNGFSASGIEQMRAFCSAPDRSKEARFEGLASIAERHASAGREDLARSFRRSALMADPEAVTAERVRGVMAPEGRSVHVDVLMVSDFGLPGGTTGSNIQEVRAQSTAGLRTGLLSTPFRPSKVGRPVNPKVLEVVDGDRVQFVHWSDRITCDLLLVRHPKVCENLLEDLPEIRAGRTVLVVNQPPCERYGVDGPSPATWDPGRVRAVLDGWVGEHTWYPIGPAVRSALLEHHGAELDGVELAEDDWVNIIDLAAWRRPRRREHDGTARVGRHTRDEPVKWPELPGLLEAAYPSGQGREIHVLGGADSAAGVLGGVPDTWRVQGFDSVSPREFLHGLDVYSYFTASDYVEAFGRSPLEAMAAGVPTIMPPRFKPLFGDAGVYSDPFGVREEISLLMTDHDRYERQVRRAWEVLEARFSHEAHLRRIAELGVRQERAFPTIS
ncbi:hypothetical protein IDM40_05470 [Nocardiopsis sp. HNM0947]|uniref:Glycosyltransferase n=2 Tax=Nocardiopsis coralli TaxID=2772213 RepID=A0ABR9P2T6_9ACTN|nr:hypothetical protein [Nocardiopsis coralli]